MIVCVYATTTENSSKNRPAFCLVKKTTTKRNSRETMKTSQKVKTCATAQLLWSTTPKKRNSTKVCDDPEAELTGKQRQQLGALNHPCACVASHQQVSSIILRRRRSLSRGKLMSRVSLWHPLPAFCAAQAWLSAPYSPPSGCTTTLCTNTHTFDRDKVIRTFHLECRKCAPKLADLLLSTRRKAAASSQLRIWVQIGNLS